jgi:hypothetical protein
LKEVPAAAADSHAASSWAYPWLFQIAQDDMPEAVGASIFKLTEEEPAIDDPARACCGFTINR